MVCINVSEKDTFSSFKVRGGIIHAVVDLSQHNILGNELATHSLVW